MGDGKFWAYENSLLNFVRLNSNFCSVFKDADQNKFELCFSLLGTIFSSRILKTDRFKPGIGINNFFCLNICSSTNAEKVLRVQHIRIDNFHLRD